MHKLKLSGGTIGINKLTLPPALVDYYKSNAVVYHRGKQVRSECSYNLTFQASLASFDEIEIGRGRELSLHFIVGSTWDETSSPSMYRVGTGTENRSVLSFDGSQEVYCGTLTRATYIEMKLKTSVDTGENRNNVFVSCRNDGVEEIGNFNIGTAYGYIEADLYKGSNVAWQGSSGTSTSTSLFLADDEWHTFKLYVEDGDVTAELDGATETLFTSTDDVYFGNDPLWFGDTYNATQLNGSIAYALFKDGETVVSEYKFDEGSGQITDSVGSNDSTTNTATWTKDGVPIPIKEPSVLHWQPSTSMDFWFTQEDLGYQRIYYEKDGQLYSIIGIYEKEKKNISDLNIKNIYSDSLNELYSG